TGGGGQVGVPLNAASSLRGDDRECPERGKFCRSRIRDNYGKSSAQPRTGTPQPLSLKLIAHPLTLFEPRVRKICRLARRSLSPRSRRGARMRAASSQKWSIDDDAADRFTRSHQIKTLVDVLQRERMGDQIVDVDLPLHVPVDDFWYVGASLGAAKGGSLPHTTGHQLEGASGNFLTRSGDADDHTDAPPPVAAFKRLSHGPDIADALEAAVGAALGQVHQVGDEIPLDLGRV